jgi:hypothetical protein
MWLLPVNLSDPIKARARVAAIEHGTQLHHGDRVGFWHSGMGLSVCLSVSDR